MIKMLGFLMVGFIGFINQTDVVLEELRGNYAKLSNDKELCANVIVELDHIKNISAIYLGYLGGAQTINSKHVSNPLNKLKTFNKGKKNIEEAIRIEPENLELRFIRLLVQKNTPSFLNYYSKVEEDTQILSENRHKISSINLRRNIEKILNE
ncbi:hypothetical protein OBK16_12340 [Empedobacter falsenii]